MNACVDCGIERNRSPKTRAFRSPRCRSCAIKKRWQRDGNPPLTCRKCGRSFPFAQSGSRPHLFCSRQCRSRRVEKYCPKCNKPFSVPASNASRYNFCSLLCAREPAVFRNCETCSNEFRLNASEAKVRGRFCSFACYRRFTGESSIERITREALQSLNLDFVQEYDLGKRNVFDFYVPVLRVLIECDGKYWHSLPGVKDRDQQKDIRARAKGYKVIRLDEGVIKGSAFASRLITLLVSDPLKYVNPKAATVIPAVT
jgi:very-short-patch-repair endonuclease